MKTICQKSGVPIWKTDYLIGLDLADEHPIFKARRSIILSKDMVHKFYKAENPIEKKLIFLGVLNATYLVDFQYPASPSLSTIESSFGNAMFLAQWISFAEWKLAKIVAFPQYIIRKDNADLGNIKSWLAAIDEIREKVNRKELERDKNAALLQREMEIKRELGEANFYGRAFTPRLAKWALELCDITARHNNYSKWMKILCSPLTDAWIYKMEDLLEIQEILQIGLPNLEENPQAISVMHQMSELIRECRRGFTQISSIFDDDPQTTDFEIIEENEEGVSRKIPINQHLHNVPTDAPQLKNYASKVDYLVAKAKYDLAQRSIGGISSV
jgi:hypothetical protein